MLREEGCTILMKSRRFQADIRGSLQDQGPSENTWARQQRGNVKLSPFISIFQCTHFFLCESIASSAWFNGGSNLSPPQRTPCISKALQGTPGNKWQCPNMALHKIYELPFIPLPYLSLFISQHLPLIILLFIICALQLRDVIDSFWKIINSKMDQKCCITLVFLPLSLLLPPAHTPQYPEC